MGAFICKQCGGSLNVTPGMTVCQCPYCLVEQTVSATDDEKKIALFNRANQLRFGFELDKAAGVYESIIADFPDEAEAYWGLVLCKYGIEYVDDPATGKKIPTCYRSSFESIPDDPDYAQAIANADPLARPVYQAEALQFEALRKSIIEISNKEEPYDIFICYKDRDEDGHITEDCMMARRVYDALTQKGYRVFFSRITLEEKLGREYEPYIFAALNSAKIMLAFGTKYDYYNAVWVKNEWSRFLKLMVKQSDRRLIPCYKNILPEHLPKEFVGLQALNLGDLGALEVLLKSIEKLIPSKATFQQPPATALGKTVTGEATLETLLERAYILLNGGRFNEASQHFDRILDRAPKEPQAYWGKLLASEECVDSKELVSAKKASQYFKEFVGNQKCSNMTKEILTDKLRNKWGDYFLNACGFSSKQEEKIYQELFNAASAELDKLLQQKIRKEYEQEQDGLKRELKEFRMIVLKCISILSFLVFAVAAVIVFRMFLSKETIHGYKYPSWAVMVVWGCEITSFVCSSILWTKALNEGFVTEGTATALGVLTAFIYPVVFVATFIYATIISSGPFFNNGTLLAALALTVIYNYIHILIFLIMFACHRSRIKKKIRKLHQQNN